MIKQIKASIVGKNSPEEMITNQKITQKIEETDQANTASQFMFFIDELHQ